jgi:peptidoglycan/LPS O-acetylase OafA/YrhL
VFWCISGFIFFWKYRSLIADGLVSGRKFFVLRFSRLYPLHLVTLFLVAVLQLVHHRINGHFFFTYIVDLPYFISQLFMASGWGYPNPSSFNGPIWSISVEVLVYFAFFLMLKYLSRSALVNIAIIALCVVAHRLKITHGSVDCLAFFYIGGLSAIACQDIKSLLLRKSLDILGWLAFFLVPLAVWRFQLYQHKYFEYLFLFLYSPVVLFCVSKEFRVGPVAQKVIEAFGNMTYSSYLLQFPVELAIVTALSAAKLSAPLYDPRFFLAYLGFVLTASYLTYRNFEAPMQRWLRKSLKSGGSKGIMPA